MLRALLARLVYAGRRETPCEAHCSIHDPKIAIKIWHPAPTRIRAALPPFEPRADLSRRNREAPVTQPPTETDDHTGDSIPPSAMFRPGELIDNRYRVVRQLGQGGYGTVYLAEEIDSANLLGLTRHDLDDADRALAGNAPPLGVLRPVAVKVIDPRRLDAKRFAAELRALCRLNHPGIVTIYGYGRTQLPAGTATPGANADDTWIETPGPQHGSTFYLAMEFIDGEPLSDWSGARAMAVYPRMLGVLIHVAEALAHAHERGVVHRDLKPHNILIAADGLPRVVDFGLSWLLRNDDPASQRVGTPGFLAPELLAGNDPHRDHRADIYGFGATAFALFAGQSPFYAEGVYATVRRQLDGRFEFPDAFPQPLRSMVRRCLATDPLDRPRAAALVAEELRRAVLARAVVSADESASTLQALPTLPERVDVRDARVRGLQSFDHPTRGAGVKFELVTSPDDQDAATGVFAYADRDLSMARRVYDVASWMWEGAELSLYGARTITRKDGARFLAADGSTVPVLEPYFPVTVSDVARADGVRAGACASRVLVDMRRKRTPGRPLVVGSLAHDMLERLVRDATTDFDELFDASLPAYNIELVAAGVGDADLATIRDGLRGHFENLERWTQTDSNTRRGRVAEVRRFSSRYGLEGRIDLSVIDDAVTRIVELKTGRFESPEHERQLRCYTLMWDDLAGKQNRSVEGHLLYSATGKAKPLNRRSHEREREVVIARNDVVAMHRWFSDGDTAFRPPRYSEFPNRCADSPCKFRRKDCEEQTNILGSMCGSSPAPENETSGSGGTTSTRGAWGDVPPALVEASRAYYFHFLRLIEREYRSASQDMGAVFRRETVHERAEKLRAVINAEICHSSAPDRTVTFACDARGVFDLGDSVIAHRGDFDAEPCLVGKVTLRTQERLTIECNGADFATELQTDGWVIDRDILRIGFSTMHRALYELISSRDARRLERIVMPALRTQNGQRGLDLGDLESPAIEVVGQSGRELNEAQQDAVQQALQAHDAFLIHGPPGTGKTTVIAELVARLVADGKRVLVAACTHTAVDTVLTRVVRSGVSEVLRVGGGRRPQRDLQRALHEAGRDPKMHMSRTLGQEAQSLEHLQQRLLSTPVFAATTNACASDACFQVLASGLDDPAPFDVVIIDEASQLTEPLALAAINRAKRFVLVGDDQQLPPVVTAPDATSAIVGVAQGPLAGADIRGLDHSLFARLRPHVPHVLLRVQYRMNASIQHVPNLAFYDARLVADDHAASRSLYIDAPAFDALSPAMQAVIDPALPSVWVPTDEEGSRPRIHLDEADDIVKTIEALLTVCPAAASGGELIGVVAPYRAQCHAIRSGLREALGPERAAWVEVDTVERFQGREKEVVLVSLTSAAWSDFVMHPQRLNVTLTRARSKLIVFGSLSVRRRFSETFGVAPPPTVATAEWERDAGGATVDGTQDDESGPT